MNRVKVAKNRNYTTINNEPLKDTTLSLKAKGLLAVIMSLPDSWDFTINGIIAITKEGKGAVYSAIKELEDAGYCSREMIRNDNNQFEGCDYTFYEVKQVAKETLTDFPHTGKPLTENPHTGFPHTENRPQLNTNRIKERINDDDEGEKTENSSPPPPPIDFHFPNPSFKEQVIEQDVKELANKVFEDGTMEMVMSAKGVNIRKKEGKLIFRDLLKAFIAHLAGIGVSKKAERDFRSHFINWTNKQPLSAFKMQNQELTNLPILNGRRKS